MVFQAVRFLAWKVLKRCQVLLGFQKHPKDCKPFALLSFLVLEVEAKKAIGEKVVLRFWNAEKMFSFVKLSTVGQLGKNILVPC